MSEVQKLLALALFRSDFPDGPIPIEPPESAMKWAEKFMESLGEVGAAVVPRVATPEMLAAALPLAVLSARDLPMEAKKRGAAAVMKLNAKDTRYDGEATICAAQMAVDYASLIVAAQEL